MLHPSNSGIAPTGGPWLTRSFQVSRNSFDSTGVDRSGGGGGPPGPGCAVAVVVSSSAAAPIKLRPIILLPSVAAADRRRIAAPARQCPEALPPSREDGQSGRRRGAGNRRTTISA